MPLFDSLEYAALLPVALPSRGTPFDALPAVDPAGDARADVTAGDAAKALAPFGRLTGLVRFQLALFDFAVAAPTLLLLHAAGACGCLVVGAVIAAGTGGFTTASLAVGTVTAMLGYMIAVYNYAVFYARRDKERNPLAVLFPSPAVLAGRASLARHLVLNGSLAGIVRWAALVGNRTKGANEELGGLGESSSLLTHDADDPACPCPQSTCGGALLSRIPRERLSAMAWFVLMRVTGFLAMCWTPVVTLASRTWSQPWSAALLAVFLAVQVPSLLFATGATGIEATPSSLRLTSRLRLRAVTITLSRMLASCRAVLAGKADLPDASEYATLGPLLAAQCRAGTTASFHPSTTLRNIALFVLCGAANAIEGQCLPAGTIVVLAWLLGILFMDLWNVAVLNAEGASLCALHASALDSLSRDLLAAQPACSPPASTAALGHVQAHAGVLARLARGGGGAKFLAFEVGFGSIRALFLGVVTVTFGVWGVLRGVGVGVVWESYCPA